MIQEYFQHILEFENNIGNQSENKQPILPPPAPILPKRRGRPQGSKSQQKIQPQGQEILAQPAPQSPAPIVPKARGRPLGSKNRPKPATTQ
jgi:hypothetical protein